MIVLDTNVLSALMRRVPEPVVVAWLDRQPRVSVWTTAVAVFEVRYGLGILPPGRRRDALLAAFGIALTEKIDQRIAVFDSASADEAANLMAARHRQGRPVGLRDTMVAGIVIAHRAILATRNTKHFADLPVTVVNPWDGD